MIGITSPIEECIERMNLRDESEVEERIKLFERDIKYTYEISDVIINNSKQHWQGSMKIISIIKQGIFQECKEEKGTYE